MDGAAKHLPLWTLAGLGALFAMRVAAGPHIFDAGELIAASWDLGGSHPPGQPLHALLAHALARLPLGPIGARIALFSAGCTLLACALAATLARELAEHLQAPARALPIVESAAILGVGLTGPVLRQALRAEVYALSLALTLLAMLHLTRWALGGPGRHLAFAGFAAGLAACAQPLHALSAALFGLALALPRLGALLRRPWSVLWSAAFGVLGLFAYAYLPARALAGASMWGRPQQLGGFLDYVSGKAYAHNTVLVESAPWFARALEVCMHAAISGAGLGLLGLLLFALRRDAHRGLAGSVALGGMLGLSPAWLVSFDPAIPDSVGYFAPAAAVLIAGGAAALGAMLAAGSTRAVGGVGLTLLALGPHALAHAPQTLRSDAPVLETLMGSLIDTPPPRALVVPTTDFVGGGWMMARSVGGARPDTALFVAGLATSSWQWESMGRHPGLSGKPVRGPGRNNHRRYLRGAILSALASVPVAVERDLSGLPVRAIAGSYALLARGDTEVPIGRAQRSIGERLHDKLARDAAAADVGDGGAVAAILRDQLSHRGRRLLATAHVDEGLASLADSLWPLPADQRTRMLAPPAGPDAGAVTIPRLVEDRNSFLMSRGEAVRMTGAALWAAGRREQGMLLLEAQGRDGEPRAILQLAWLQLYDGEPDAARKTLDGLLSMAPELEPESRPLKTMLARLSARPR